MRTSNSCGQGRWAGASVWQVSVAGGLSPGQRVAALPFARQARRAAAAWVYRRARQWMSTTAAAAVAPRITLLPSKPEARGRDWRVWRASTCLARLVAAGSQHPVAVLVPLRLHDGPLVPVQRGQAAPRLGAPQLDQGVLGACGGAEAGRAGRNAGGDHRAGLACSAPAEPAKWGRSTGYVAAGGGGCTTNWTGTQARQHGGAAAPRRNAQPRQPLRPPPPPQCRT